MGCRKLTEPLHVTNVIQVVIQLKIIMRSLIKSYLKICLGLTILITQSHEIKRENSIICFRNMPPNEPVISSAQPFKNRFRKPYYRDLAAKISLHIKLKVPLSEREHAVRRFEGYNGFQSNN